MTAQTGHNSIGLTAAIRAGNEFAFEEAFRLYREKLYHYFLPKTGNREDALDLVQNCFTRLWQYRASISPEFLLEQQLFHIARTVLIDHLRRQTKQAKIRRLVAGQNNLNHLNSLSHHPSSDIECNDRLQKALAPVPETRRRVFYLNRIEGYSYREIADILSISVKAADNSLSKAVRQLKKAFIFLAVIFIH